MSALSLHSQLETSNGFPEIMTILQGGELECPDQPRPVLLCIARDPGVRLRDSRPARAAPSAGLRHRHRPDRSRLRGEANDGRRYCYQIQAHLPLPEPASQEPAIAGAHGPARGRRRETAADRDRPEATASDPELRDGPGPPASFPARALPPDEPRRPCHRRAQRRTRHRIRPCPASIFPGLVAVAARFWRLFPRQREDPSGHLAVYPF